MEKEELDNHIIEKDFYTLENIHNVIIPGVNRLNSSNPTGIIF
jgi:hypothetical protein